MNSERIKKHFRKHKWKYIIGGTIVLAGVTTLILRESRAVLYAGADCPVTESAGSFNSARSIFGSANNNVVTTIHRGTSGHPGFVTRCVETGELFETQGAAARNFDIDPWLMSEHLNKGRILQEGLHFERVGVFA